MLRITNLQKTFRPPDGSPAKPVVDIPAFSLAAGDQLALLGSSGSGKTTFLHLLAGILTPDAGTIQYTLPNSSSKEEATTDIAKLPEPARDHFRGQHIGYIFQTHHLLPGLTALENVLLGLSFTGRHPDRPWARHLLDRVGLADRLHYKPGKLSVGQQQRVAVARALANRPRIVLADEPTGALDPATAQQTLDLIRSLCREVSAALLLVTHDLAIARQLPRQVTLADLNRAASAASVAGAKVGGSGMNLFELILKQMRQRLLSTLLTCLSVLLGVMLATCVLILQREGRALFAQTDYGFDLIVGPKASPLQLVLNTVYHMDVSPGNIPYSLYEDMSATGDFAEGRPKSSQRKFRGLIQWAIPIAVGDSYQGRRIVGTTPQLFGVDDSGRPLPPDLTPHYARDATYTFAQGLPFAPNKFEAVIGSEVAQSTGLTLGSTFHATHGLPGPNDIPDIHDETWTVVGILNPTHTANDRVLFIPLLTFYAIFEHESGLKKIGEIQSAAKPAPASKPAETPGEKAYTLNPDGTINVKLPKNEWEISAILVQTRSPAALLNLQFVLRNLPDAVGVSPAQEMAKFFDTFLPKITLLLLLISAMVIVVACVSVLVSIYNSVAARSREIAIMRALGATRTRVLAIVCLEAALNGALGALLGLVAGHLLAAAGSLILYRLMGTSLPWYHLSPLELPLLPLVISISLLAGLVPALKAYNVSVAENLTS